MFKGIKECICLLSTKANLNCASKHLWHFPSHSLGENILEALQIRCTPPCGVKSWNIQRLNLVWYGWSSSSQLHVWLHSLTSQISAQDVLPFLHNPVLNSACWKTVHRFRLSPSSLAHDRKTSKVSTSSGSRHLRHKNYIPGMHAEIGAKVEIGVYGHNEMITAESVLWDSHSSMEKAAMLAIGKKKKKKKKAFT